jgi:hypothetical protein
MKRCPYCGKEYPADATVCSIDETPLEDLDPPKTAPEPKEPEPLEIQTPFEAIDENADVDAPEGFRLLGTFEPMDADRMLQQFIQNNLRFQIDHVEGEKMMRWGYRKVGFVVIYVHEKDFEAASKIMTADWKV